MGASIWSSQGEALRQWKPDRIPINSVYSGVVSLKSLSMVIFLTELNDLETWATDMGNAYLEAERSEKVIIAGPEFGELVGHTLVIFKVVV
jgi:hypothetical protein